MVFVQGHISAVVQVIFNTPIGASHLKEFLGRDFLSGQAGDATDDLLLNFTGFRKSEASFEFEDLLLVGPIQEVFELAAHRECVAQSARDFYSQSWRLQSPWADRPGQEWGQDLGQTTGADFLLIGVGCP